MNISSIVSGLAQPVVHPMKRGEPGALGKGHKS